MPFDRTSRKGTRYPEIPDPATRDSLAAAVDTLDAYALDQWATNVETTGGLVYGYKGGVVASGTTYIRVPDGTVTLAPNATNYVERDSAGTVSLNQTGFTADNLPMAKITTDSLGITDLEDWRVLAGTTTGGPGGSHVLATTSGLGPLHTVSGLTAGMVLKATAASAALFGFLSFAEISGTVADAQVPASAVIQHQGALSISWSQLTGVPTSFNPITHPLNSAYHSGTLGYNQLPTGGGTWNNGGALTITGGITTVEGLTSTALITAQAGISVTSGQALLWSADNAAGSTIGASGASRPYGVYVGTELVVRADPGGTDAVRILAPSAAGVLVVADGAGTIFQAKAYGLSAVVALRRYQGTLASPSAINTNNLVLGAIFFQGYDGATVRTSAVIDARSQGAWTGTSNGTYLAFATIATGSTTLTGRWVMDENGLRPGTQSGTASNNLYDLGSATSRVRTGYFGTSVVTPVLDSGTATDLVLRRNGVTKLTLGGSLASFADPVDAPSYQVSGTKVVGARVSGWATSGWTVSQSRAAFNPASVSLATLAQVVQALIADLGASNHGLIDAVVAA